MKIMKILIHFGICQVLDSILNLCLTCLLLLSSHSQGLNS